MSAPTDLFSFALMLPVYHQFDYRVGESARCLPGQRYVLPFGRGEKVGILLSRVQQSLQSAEKLKPVLRRLDEQPLLSTHVMQLASWMADYYCQPYGDILFQCLPRYCRQPRPVRPTTVDVWTANDVKEQQLDSLQRKAPRQYAMLRALIGSESGLSSADLRGLNNGWRQLVRGLEEKQLVRRSAREDLPTGNVRLQTGPTLGKQQQQVLQAISIGADDFQVHLLQGVTGSGKTEVYLGLMQRIIERGMQIIYLVPEIGLTPQLLQRLSQRLGPAIVSSHSAQTDYQRYRSWDQFRRGAARVMIGTRSALFSDASSLGLIIIDEEHDASYRQQDGVRYHARDVAIKRAQMLGIPIVLGSATPSLETLQNLHKPHYHLHRLDERPDNRQPPSIALINCRNSPLTAGCSPPLLQAIDRHLLDKGQVLLFLNRRGYAPVVMCYECGWQAMCHQCDARLTLHQSVNRLICHHCGYGEAVTENCPECAASGVRHYGVGTQQLESFLQTRFPDVEVIRIDRDSVSAGNSLHKRLAPVVAGRPCILVGTQMLAKGHDYPDISLVGIIDADQALHSSYYRATERLVQTVLQVAGRAGRADRPGQALLQTSFVDHPLMQNLCRQGYSELVMPMLEERRLLGFPPFARAVSFVADAVELQLAMHSLQQLKATIQGLGPAPDIRIVGPIPALMTRRIGRYRAQLSLLSRDTEPLRMLLGRLMPLIETKLNGRKSHIVIEVDPLDL